MPPDSKWKILTALDLSPFPGVLEPLYEIAEVRHIQPITEDLIAAIPDCDGYLASLQVCVTADVLRHARKLRVIVTPSTGTDHLDLRAAAERGVDVLSLKNDIEFLSSVTATAELAWALLLALSRRLPEATASALRGEWSRDRFRGRQLSGKTLGVLGYGRLGRIVAEYGRAFRMRVLACDVREVEPAAGVEMVNFKCLLAESDVLSIHVHLDGATRGLIDKAAFNGMKRGAILLNTSRGAVIDEHALIEALDNGQLAGAGLDVIHGEWNTQMSDHPLIRYANAHPNLIITPHIGGITHESQAAAFAWTVRKLVNYLNSASREVRA